MMTMIGPVYHASVLPRSMVLQAPVIHVGTLQQALVIHNEDIYAGTKELFFRRAVNGVISDDIKKVKVHHNGSSIFEFFFYNNSIISDNVLDDDEANAVHMLHAQKNEYPISTSVCNSSSFFTKRKHLLDALDALHNGYVVPYNNTGEGRRGGTSYLVPNPRKVLAPKDTTPARCSINQVLNGILDVRNDHQVSPQRASSN